MIGTTSNERMLFNKQGKENPQNADRQSKKRENPSGNTKKRERKNLNRDKKKNKNWVMKTHKMATKNM